MRDLSVANNASRLSARVGHAGFVNQIRNLQPLCRLIPVALLRRILVRPLHSLCLNGPSMTALMGSIDRNDPYMKWRRLLLACATLLAASFSAGAASDVADPAVVKIRTFYDTLLTVMQQADKLGIRGRYDKLAPSIHTTFDLAAMTRIAIGPGWNSIAPEQQAALVENFSRMTIATYANRFDGYSGERFEVAPASEARTTGRIVRSKLVPSSGESITLDYLMRGS